MSRNYGSLGRRSNSAVWQWVIVGLVIGFACSATLILGGMALGVVQVGGQGLAFGPSPTPLVITATPLPVTPTLTPTEVLMTPTEFEVIIEAPTATPTTDPALFTPEATNTGTPTATSAIPAFASNNAAGGGVEVPAALAGLATELRAVAGGEFQMGTTPAEVAAAVSECVDGYGGQCTPAMAEDAYPQHAVTVSPFRMEVTEVTYEQYVTFLNLMGPGSHANGCDGQPCLATRVESDTSNVTYDSANYDVPDVINNLPVVEVTWFGAKAYCEAIGRRLPTETEWERAARGDDGRVFPWGGSTFDSSLVWTNRSAPDNGEEGGPVPVDSYPLGASPYGMLNMAGNVAEWVSDWYDDDYYAQAESAQPDPIGPPLGDEKVARGGSWDAVPFFARTMHRQSRRPNEPAPWLGFRCAADAATPNVANTGAQGNTNLTAPVGTPNPATLGQNIPGDEGDLGNSAPTLQPPPTSAAPVAPTGLPNANPTTRPTLAPG